MPKNILIVDDDEEIRNLLELTLTNSGFVINSSQDGMEALEKIKNFKPDLIISDIMMPRMNGFVLCEKVKKDRELKNIPIILLSSRDDDADRYYNDYIEPDAFFHKPFNPDELINKIKDLII